MRDPEAMTVDSRELFLQARSLLRSLGDVVALGDNPLTRDGVLNMRSLGLPDDVTVVEIAHAVQRAISRLSPRERRIVHGDRLGLGRRQYFRIRRAALIKIARSLAESQRGALNLTSGVPAGRAMRMSEAAAAYQLGLTRTSLNSLRLALAESADSVERFDAQIAIAHLYANEGSYQQTRKYLAEARSSLADFRDAQPRRTLVLDMLALESARYYNDPTLDVCSEVGRAENRTLALTRFTLDRDDAGAVAEALASLAEIRFELSEFERAANLMSACMAVVAREPEIEGRSLYRALSAAATISMVLADGLPNAADYYAQAYRIALSRNALRDSVVAVARLCSIWRVAGMPQRALTSASAILTRARRVCAGTVFAGIALDFAAAKIDAGCDEGVAPLIAEAATHSEASTFDFSLGMFLKAQYLQRQNRLRDALSLVHEARNGFRRAKRLAHESAALRIAAELQARLGQRREATASVDDALSILTQKGAPHSLERAYGASAAITGNPEHRRLSEELRAERKRIAQGLAGIVSLEVT